MAMEPLGKTLDEIAAKIHQPPTREVLMTLYQEARARAKAVGAWIDTHPYPYRQPELVAKWETDREIYERSLPGYKAPVYSCPTCHDSGCLMTPDGPIPCPDCRQTNREEILKRYAGHPERRWKDTFETFDIEKAPRMKQAVKAAFEFCQRTSAPWLVLAGPVGLGKTHICYAIANQLAKEGVKCRYWTVTDLLDAIRHTDDTGKNGEGTMAPMTVEEMAFDPDILILDDLGVQKTTDWVTEKLFEIIDRRYRQGKGLVITTNEPFAQLSDRLQSRFRDPEMCHVVVCDSPDFRPQLAVQKDKKRGKKGGN